MKTVILAGGYGTRLAEHTDRRPKPMVEVGGNPVLWHIMQIYASHGFKEFVVACGYKGEVIKLYFDQFAVANTDYRIHLRDGRREVLRANAPDWTVSAVDTGLDTMTGGRLSRLAPMLDDTFMVTYGDGLADVDIGALVAFHRSHGKLATVTAVHPPARFGGLALEDDRVARFTEKPQAEAGWINGGFFVFEPGALAYMGDDDTMLERAPLERLTREGQLMAFRHRGFWQPMDTLREKRLLDRLWASGDAPWKTWE
jgi:glucose-1-phosphate cytidylyltransferase